MPSQRQGDPTDAWWQELKDQAQRRGLGEEHILPVGSPEVEDEDAGPTLAELRATPVVICPRPAEAALSSILRELWVASCDEDDDPDCGFR